MHKKGISLFSVEFFLSQSAKKNRKGTLPYFENIPVSKNFMHRRGASRFCRIFLSHLTETESFVKEHFCLPENCWYRKNLWIRGGISRFSVEIFMSHSTEKIREHPFNVSENLGYRKILCIIGGITIFRRKFLVSKSYMDEEGEYQDFPSKIFCLAVPKNFVGESLVLD